MRLFPVEELEAVSKGAKAERIRKQATVLLTSDPEIAVRKRLWQLRQQLHRVSIKQIHTMRSQTQDPADRGALEMLFVERARAEAREMTTSELQRMEEKECNWFPLHVIVDEGRTLSP
ncbi:hypothetical protein HY285_02265 [Candidatus Peregrinibacteria bacterium]|nr:hypothetical protein [Candidatus Peregrinibacteria bacterium]MBI3816347.1 hypothetical protein [Candidatus Peregrinibacteria bacterium]